MSLLTLRNRRGGLGRLQNDVNDLFSRFFSDWAEDSPRGYWPAMDLSEKDDRVILTVELPGMKADDIDISVQGNTLTLSGQKTVAHEEKDVHYYHRERCGGSFQRVITLPNDVDTENIQARHNDGVLTITLPKSETAKPKRIAVEK
jgi:HSP20 family protein